MQLVLSGVLFVHLLHLLSDALILYVNSAGGDTEMSQSSGSAAPEAGKSSAPPPASGRPAVPESTALFRALNPELYIKPVSTNSNFMFKQKSY